MHDPMTVAFDIPRPFPQRTSYPRAASARWQWGYVRNRRWHPSPFMTLAGRGFYWPALITVWHNEPGGRDAGEVCKYNTLWKWHIHHWSIQVRPLQHLRRWALTRCAWCGGKSRKGDRVNCGKGWHAERAPWWRGEVGLYHSGCLSAERAWQTCTCESPSLTQCAGYGQCDHCGRFRPWGLKPEDARRAESTRQAIAQGERPAPGWFRAQLRKEDA